MINHLLSQQQARKGGKARCLIWTGKEQEWIDGYAGWGYRFVDWEIR